MSYSRFRQLTELAMRKFELNRASLYCIRCSIGVATAWHVCVSVVEGQVCFEHVVTLTATMYIRELQ